MRRPPGAPPVAAFVLGLAALAHAQGTFIDQLFERHVRVKSAAGPPGVLHLLYERKANPQAPPSSCYRRCVVGKGWLPEERLHGGHRCVAFLGDTLYVFRRASYSLYRAKDWRAQAVFPAAGSDAPPASEWQTRAWPLKWLPEAACAVGDALWVFGVEGAGSAPQFRAASIAPAASDAAAPGPRLLGKPLATPASPSDLSALAEGAGVRVFWHQPAAGREGNEVWHAAFDGDAWAPPRPVALPYANSDFAVARHEGAIWLVCKERGRRVTELHPLVTLTLADGKWTEPATVPGARDPWLLDSTLDVDAASFGGSLLVFRACMNRVVAHTRPDGTWQAPEMLIELSPWPTYLFWWLVGNAGACLVLLPAVGWAALHVRGRPSLRVRAFGTDVRLATWTRRVAAQLVDVLMGLLLCTGILRWLETARAGTATESEGILATVAVCSAVFFAYYVVSEGLGGQSFGKLLLRIAVVDCDGRRPSWRAVVVRNLLRPWPFLVPAAYLVGSLALLLSRRSQRLGDLLGRTLVVDLPPPPGPQWPAEDE